MQKKAILSLSGGLDSCTTLAWLLHYGFEVLCVFFSYGSKHNTWENPTARAFYEYYKQKPLSKMKMLSIDLSSVFCNFTSDLLLSGGAIPEGHYEAENMKATVVPARNIIFLSILTGLAESEKISKIALGIHQGDHAIYPDCRQEFFKAMDTAVYLGTDGAVSILAPFIEGDKADIVAWGRVHQVPYELTRTCYKNQPLACGKCGSCVERLESFEKNGMVDPIQYEK